MKGFVEYMKYEKALAETICFSGREFYMAISMGSIHNENDALEAVAAEYGWDLSKGGSYSATPNGAGGYTVTCDPIYKNGSFVREQYSIP